MSERHDGSPGRELAGSTALVTGASSGIGEVTARALADRGARVALVARRADRLADLVTRIEGDGGAALAIPADLSDPEGAAGAVTRATEHFGALDLVVNNAGYGARRAVEESDPADWEKMIALNLGAVLHVSRAALPHLLRAAESGPRGVADLVNIASVAGRVPRKNNSVYSATKHAVVSFSESLRQEVTTRRVRVGLVEPGMTETEMTRGGQSTAGRGMPPQDWLHARDVARAIVFMVTQPPHAAVNELLLRPTAQEH
ncbi:SDR family oxidoreductase [Streptomyces sp. NPDC007088]|uniref:SDR family oxidoreductase n=1 Tax=Streptomyces sp. NPDC007088 TaxID=3364773 RepID=UPI0036A32F15